MHPGTLQALEFDRIVRVVRGFALTPLGTRRLGSLRPLTDPRRVAAAQAATSEATRYLTDHGAFPLAAPADLEATLSALAIEGRPLEPLRLLALAAFLDSFDASKAGVKKVATSCPILSALVEPTAGFRNESQAIRDRIDPSGEVIDSASPELRARPGAPAPPARTGCAARSSRTCAAARPPSTCRIRSSPTATAVTSWWSARNTATPSPASCTAPRPAAPACTWNRSARSR